MLRRTVLARLGQPFPNVDRSTKASLIGFEFNQSNNSQILLKSTIFISLKSTDRLTAPSTPASLHLLDCLHFWFLIIFPTPVLLFTQTKSTMQFHLKLFYCFIETWNKENHC